MDALYNQALRLSRRSEDAGDLVQETYLRAYRTFANFKEGTNCKAWLFTILYSIFVNKYRKDQREPDTVSIEELEETFHRTLADGAWDSPTDTIRTRLPRTGSKPRLVGGRVQYLRGQGTEWVVYSGPNNQALVCQMYVGKVSELPVGSAEREHRGKKFYVYQVKGVTVVFWQDRKMVCVLISDMPAENVVQLAFAKAPPL